MEDTQCIEKLMLFGLTRQEALLYLCLLQNGSLTGYEAAKQTGISRSNAYSALADLTAQGAACMLEGNPSKYTAVALTEFCENCMHRLREAGEYLEKHVPKAETCKEGYVTIAGSSHIKDKIRHMLKGAEKRVYFSASEDVVKDFNKELCELAERGIKVVVISKQKPEGVDILFYRALEDNFINKQQQIRLIIDSAYVLTGDMIGSSSDTCLYSDQDNFVSVFKEAMHNEIKLIELRDRTKED